jgi:hypothetical protein
MDSSWERNALYFNMQHDFPEFLISTNWHCHQPLTFIIKPVCNLVTNDNTDASIVQRLWEVLAVEERLKDSSREYCNISYEFTTKQCLPRRRQLRV